MNDSDCMFFADGQILGKLLERNPIPIVEYDHECRISHCNPAFCDLTGMTRDAILNKRVSDFRIITMEGDGVQTTIAQKRPGKARIEIDLPSGRKTLIAHTIPAEDESMEAPAAFGMYLDITREENEKRKNIQIIRDNPIPFLLLGTDLKVIRANHAFLTLTGYTDGQLNTMALSDFMIRTMKGDSATTVIKTKKPAKSETTVDFPSGRKTLMLHSIPIITKSGDIDQILITCVDLTRERSVSEYLVSEITRLSMNLTNLAEGDLNFDLTVKEADQYTEEAFHHFQKIQNDLKGAQTALNGIIREINALTEAIRKGDLNARGRPEVFQGTYASIVEGLNSVMEEVEKPIHAAITLSGDYASGHFDATPPAHKAEGDFFRLKEALLNIGVQVSDILRIIDQEIEDLTTQAEEANAGVKDVAEGSRVVAKNAQDVSIQAEKGRENLDQIQQAMMDLSANVQEVASSTEAVTRATHDTNDLSQHGVELAHKSEKGMDAIMVSTADVNRIISDIKEEMLKIGKIVSVITDIASQTNLLALNAAIEAARAGEAGRGFAVVASEVKSLALESRRSAENIAEMIKSLQNKSDQAAMAMKLAESAVQEGNTAVNETLGIFNQIVESVENISRNMDDVSATTEQQAAAVEEITASTSEVKSLVDSIADEAISSAAAAEQSASGTGQIATVIEDLNHVILKVSSAVGKFSYT